jgi:hypothetical protein
MKQQDLLWKTGLNNQEHILLLNKLNEEGGKPEFR